MSDEVNDSTLQSRDSARAFIRQGLYPLLWIWVIAGITYGLIYPETLQTVLAVKAVGMVGLLLILEWRFPYDDRWRMTWRHLVRRDLIFIAINGATIALLSYGMVALAIDLSADSASLITGQPLWLQVIVGLVVFEALQYTLHRYMHQSRGPLTHFLWRTHAIHHLPQQLYVVMHAVFHPFNAVLVRIGTQLLPLWLLGYDPLAVFVFGSIIAFHGTVSHLNLDMRMGWMNYLFVGPELHRYHHSASSHEAQNYGATLSIFDLCFSTFLYRPGVPPLHLGLSDQDGYPGQHDPLAATLFPFSVEPVRQLFKPS
jgi:sterol desaturase/sphingolipid hydroxylase (fatty acid hydroxylase superfamily)